MTLTFNEYQRRARRTAMIEGFTPRERKCHWTLGIVGEVGEVEAAIRYNNKKGAVEELTDAFWCVSQLAYEYDISLESIIYFNDVPEPENTEDVKARFARAIGEWRNLDEYTHKLAEAVKKLEFYPAEKRKTAQRRKDMEHNLMLVTAHILHLARVNLSANVRDALLANLEKLEERYQPEGFALGGGIREEK